MDFQSPTVCLVPDLTGHRPYMESIKALSIMDDIKKAYVYNKFAEYTLVKEIPVDRDLFKHLNLFTKHQGIVLEKFGGECWVRTGKTLIAGFEMEKAPKELTDLLKPN